MNLIKQAFRSSRFKWLSGVMAGTLTLGSVMAPVSVVSTASAAAGGVIFEAENGTLNGTAVSSAQSGYSGTGYVNGFDASSDSVTIPIQASLAGLYNVYIGYRAPYGSKYTSMYVNGTANGEVSLPETASFTEAPAGKLLLPAGASTIQLVNDWGWYEIDYVRIEPAAQRGPHAVSKTLSNSNATPEAKSLMSYLVDQYGKSMISGQQDLADAQWVGTNIGKLPAAVGFDLIDYSPSRVEHGTSSTEVEKAISWDSQGGIVTFCWHWNAPTGLIDQPGKEWWRGFYTDSTTFDVEYAMNHPESTEYQLLVRDIDAIAVQLKRLQAAHVPVLFRPLHEAEGGWFWWGAKGPAPAKALYKLVFDRLTNYHGLNNLIWIWNSVSPDWYPGDQYVDILSYDSYPQNGDYSPQSAKYERLLQLGNDHKLIAMSENGAIPDPDLVKIYQADWSWFCTWNGNFIKDGSVNSLAHLQQVYNHPYVITLDELPNLKTYDTGTPVQAPGAFTLSAAGGTSITLSWTASANAASYDVKRSTSASGTFTTIASGVTGTSYTDSAVTGGTTYYYQVTAKNSAGTANSNTVSAAAAIAVPAAPTGLAAQAGDGKAVLTWNTSSGATSYTVKRALTSGGTYTAVATVTGTIYTDTGLTNGTIYYYTVSAANSAGSSAASAAVSVTPAAPVVSSGLVLQYRTPDTTPGDNQFKPHFQIVNKGTTSVSLSSLKIRYYYTIDGDKAQTYNCDYAAVGCSNMNGSLVKMASAKTGADYYLELTFKAGAGTLAPGASTSDIQIRINKNDWSNYNESNDYSYDPTKTTFKDWNKVVLYQNGAVVWGVEPQ